MRCFFIAFLFFFVVLDANAQGHRKRHRPKKRVVPTSHAINGQLGLGSIGGYFGSSAGLEYEQFITQKHQLSALLKMDGYLGGTMHFGHQQDEGEIWSATSGYYLAPGLRYHPLGNKHLVDLGLAVFFPMGVGIRRDNAHDTYSGGGSRITVRNFFGACVLEAIINFQQAGDHRLFALFVNAGTIYSNAHAINYVFTHASPNYSENAPLYAQFGVRFGGRW